MALTESSGQDRTFYIQNSLKVSVNTWWPHCWFHIQDHGRPITHIM